MAFPPSLLDTFFGCRIAFYTEPYLFEAAVDEYLFRYFSVFNVLGEAGEFARDDGVQALAFFLAQRRKVLVPVDDVVIVKNNLNLNGQELLINLGVKFT